MYHRIDGVNELDVMGEAVDKEMERIKKTRNQCQNFIGIRNSQFQISHDHCQRNQSESRCVLLSFPFPFNEF